MSFVRFIERLKKKNETIRFTPFIYCNYCKNDNKIWNNWCRTPKGGTHKYNVISH